MACPLCAAGARGAAAAEKSGGHGAGHWDYGNSARWSELSPRDGVCNLGVEQSPIDLRGGIPVRLPEIQVAYRETALRIVNNGHTIQVNRTPGIHTTIGGQRFARLFRNGALPVQPLDGRYLLEPR